MHGRFSNNKCMASVRIQTKHEYKAYLESYLLVLFISLGSSNIIFIDLIN